MKIVRKLMTLKCVKIVTLYVIIMMAIMIVFVYKKENIFKNAIDSNPIVSFGLLTDIQYADIENTLNYRKDKMRYYRNGLNMIREAVECWHENIYKNNFKFIVQLGDVTDGKLVKYRENALKSVLNELNSDFRTQIPDFRVYHIWGNHEFYNFKRSEIVNTELNSAKHMNPTVSTSANYYKLDLTNDIEIICLDFYEFSVLGFDEDEDVYKEAMNLLRKHNNNSDLNNNHGLSGFFKRFTALNGAISDKQYKWLVKQLENLKKKNRKAIICGHIPIHPETSKNTIGLAWNFQEMLDLFNNYSNYILVYLSGHDHNGAYHKCQTSNIHYITVSSILEAPPNKNSFATVKVFHDRIKIEGKGLIENYEIIY